MKRLLISLLLFGTLLPALDGLHAANVTWHGQGLSRKGLFVVHGVRFRNLAVPP